MSEEKNKELIFQEHLYRLLDSFGVGSQEGVKAGLRECQEIFDCVSISHQQQISKSFQLDDKIIKTMIKFMPSIKESIVEHEVVCCSGGRCAKNGSLEILKTVKDALDIDFDETTEDERMRLTTQNCFKKCNLGPNIMLNGKFYHKMDKAKSKKLMENIKHK